MTNFARITLLVVAATILSSPPPTVEAQNLSYSPKCNATLSLFNADPAVTSCLLLQDLFTSARDEYINSGYNFTAIQPKVDFACGPTSPGTACTATTLEKIQAGLNSDCANDTLHTDLTSSLYQLRLRVNSAPLFQQALCSQDAGKYCLADFLQTYVKWPLAYDTGVAAKIGVFGNAAGNITSTLSNELSFIACSSCSTREYTAVFAVVANILRHSPTISTTNVGLPGPVGPDPQEKISLGYIDLLNTTMSRQCGRPFLTYTVAVPPPPATSSLLASSSGTRNASRSESKSSSATSEAAQATQSTNVNNTALSASATRTSAAAGLQSSVLSTVLAGGMVFLAVLLL